MGITVLETAIEIALRAHRGQKDKAGEPYILHPLRLMLHMRNPTDMLAAVLHDVVEDSPLTLDELRLAGIPEAVVEAVDSLSRRKNEPYDDFIARVAVNPIARRVKQADLKDNMDLTRIQQPSARDVARIEKYRKALDALSQPATGRCCAEPEAR